MYVRTSLDPCCPGPLHLCIGMSWVNPTSCPYNHATIWPPMLVRTHHIRGCPCPCSEAIRDPPPCPLTHANSQPWLHTCHFLGFAPAHPPFALVIPCLSIFFSSFFCQMFVLGSNLCHVILLWKPSCFLSKNNGE